MKWIRRRPKWKHGDPVWVDVGGFPAFYRGARRGTVESVDRSGRVLVLVDGMDGGPVSVHPDNIWLRADFPPLQVER